MFDMPLLPSVKDVIGFLGLFTAEARYQLGAAAAISCLWSGFVIYDLMMALSSLSLPIFVYHGFITPFKTARAEQRARAQAEAEEAERRAAVAEIEANRKYRKLVTSAFAAVELASADIQPLDRQATYDSAMQAMKTLAIHCHRAERPCPSETADVDEWRTFLSDELAKLNA